ncbi:quattro isoform X6 [Chanodichthys erythropterus]|uniref:quattro isoform X6 n=1 Tax=Chanodichthys erythropterus TaxID=933992 RepID=UPI00351F24BD
MNPSSLDWSIQSALSSLFPPFEATAPTVLSQLFRTIEERYHGDALQCLLNFLIPAKHILESVQQAACAAYSDVLFRCEGWPLCLRDRVVIQLAPINPLLLRPGDFYLQVEPFGEQSARIVLKSLLVQEDLLGQENLVLQAGSRVLEGPAIEGTPIPETSYPSIFTESWLREINEGRQGKPLCQCVLSSDQGVVKVPWTEVANPEFLDRPKSNIWPETQTSSFETLRVKDLETEISENESQSQVPVDFLPLEMETKILPAKDGMAVSVQQVEGGSRLVKVDQGHPISSFAGKPVGWVSPNTWDSRHNRELEGEYVDLLEFNKEKETLVLNKIAVATKPLGFKLVRAAQPAPKSNVNLYDEDCNPCMQNKQPSEIMQSDPESKCRYRQSYVAALRNPVNFERSSMLPSLDETRRDVEELEPSCEGYGVGLRLKPSSCKFGQTPNQADRNPMQSFENSAQQKQSPKFSTQSSQCVPHDCISRENAESLDQHMTQQIPARQQRKSFLTGQQDLHQTVLGTKALPDKRHYCLNNSFRQDSFQMRISSQKHAKTQHLPKMGLRALPDHSGHRQDANLCLQGFNPIQHSQNKLTHASEQTPTLFQPQCSQILFQNENRHLDYKVLCDDRHCGKGLGSPVQVIKGKSRSKSRSSSSVSETTRECLQSHKPTNRSRSDVYPEIIPMLPAIQGIKHTANLVSPKLNRRQEARKEVSSSEQAGTPVVNGVELQKSHPDQSENRVQETLLSQDPTIKTLLQLGIICLPGNRDRAGRAVVEVYGGRKGWASSQLSPLEFCRLLLYLHSIPRTDVRELGLTVVIDSRKCPLPSVFYKSLLMVQEQALHAVHTILMLVDKDSNPRPEKHPGLQIDVVTTLKALHKTIDGQQLTSDLGGTFPYRHEDWLQFHQKLSLFQLDLQAASSLLQTAIRRLDVKKMDTAKDVQSCIQEQRSSMKMVLEDTRLVALQREGGSILARMRKEESRFAQSEDFRYFPQDSLEAVTCLYNQVEEAVHTLVMKSNQSLRHLEHVLLLRETEDSLSTIQTWCDAEEQSWQKDKDNTEKTLLKIEQRLQDIRTVLIQAKEKKEKGMLLIKEVERKIKGMHYPEIDVFRCNTTTFKTNLTGFLLKAEERKSELEASMDLYRFCEEASSLVKECMEYLDHIKNKNSPTCACLSTLKSFEERFKDFSPQHFQDKSSALLERHPDGIWMWNAVWAQCRDIRQRLTEILHASYRNQKPLGTPQKESAASRQEEAHLKGPTQRVISTSLGENESDPQTNPVGSHMKTRNSHDNETVMHFQPLRRDTSSVVPHCDLIMTGNTDKESAPIELPGQSVQLKEEGRSQHFHQSDSNVSTLHYGPMKKLRKYPRIYSHSDSDLRKSGQVNKHDCFPRYKALVRSHSEGSGLRSTSYNVSMSKTNAAIKGKVHVHKQTSATSCPESFLVIDSDRGSWDEQSSRLSHHDSFCSSTSGLSQSDINEKFSSDTKSDDSTLISPATHSDNSVQTQDASICRPVYVLDNNSTVLKLQRIMEELLQTEREYVRALGYVVEHYIPQLERPDVPQDLRGQRGSIFGNLEKLRDFHQHHFLQELELCLKEPFCVGRCFLKHKENFGLYALYSKNKPRSERLLIDHGKEFFKQKQQLLGDKMDLSSYLLKPVQRISKYSLLLQDMLQECESGAHVARERLEIQTALEIIQFQLRHGNNLLAMDDIQDCDVNLKEQGQLIRQDEFLLTFRKKKCYRHIFLFQDLILFSKTRRTDVGNDTYIYKQSFKTSDIGMTHNSGDSGLCFEIWFRRRKSQDTYVLQAQSREVKENWTRDLERILWEQAVYNREIRMQERVFMGIGHKPFMDIQPSEMAINDRAINCALTGRGGVPVLRLNSVGSASCTSSSESHSSPSSGWGSPSPMGRLIGPNSGDVVQYVHGTSGILEEDDLDHESGNQSALVESSESSGESVSCFSSSGHSCPSVIGGDCEHTISQVPTIGLKKQECNVKTTNLPGQTRDQPCSEVEGTSIIGKSTEV